MTFLFSIRLWMTENALWINNGTRILFIIFTIYYLLRVVLEYRHDDGWDNVIIFRNRIMSLISPVMGIITLYTSEKQNVQLVFLNLIINNLIKLFFYGKDFINFSGESKTKIKHKIIINSFVTLLISSIFILFFFVK